MGRVVQKRRRVQAGRAAGLSPAVESDAVELGLNGGTAREPARALKGGQEDFLRQVLGVGPAAGQPVAEPVEAVAVLLIECREIGARVGFQSLVLFRWSSQ